MNKTTIRVIRTTSSITKYVVEIDGVRLMQIGSINRVYQWDCQPFISEIRKMGLEQGIEFGTELVNVTMWSEPIYHEEENFEESFCEYVYITPTVEKTEKSEHQLLTEALDLQYDSEYGETIRNALRAKLDTLNAL